MPDEDRSVAPVDPATSVRWTHTSVITVNPSQGLFGVPQNGDGRLFPVGVDRQGSVELRGTVRAASTT